jgi:hypothetical protein
MHGQHRTPQVKPRRNVLLAWFSSQCVLAM